MTANPHNLALEPAAQAFAEATDQPPYLFQLPPEEGRKAVDGVQDGDIAMAAARVEVLTVPGGPTGDVETRIVRPAGVDGPLPVIVYIHGAGWVFGDFHTHERLVRELAAGVGAAVVFPEYGRSPEARYPVAIEQNYAVAQWVAAHGAEQDLDTSRIAVAGDSVGGNMTAALTLMAKQRGDVTFTQQVLFYPVTDANFDTESYRQFAEGYFLAPRRHEVVLGPVHDRPRPARGDHRVAAARVARRARRPAAGAGHHRRGRRASRRRRGLRGKLRQAGVPVTAVRYQGIIHDFVMLNALRETHAAEAAITQAITVLTRALAKYVRKR